MWKHKNFINLQLCAVPPELWNIFIDGEDVSVSTTGVKYTWEYCLGSTVTITSTNVLYNNKVLQYNSVDVLPTDTIVSNGEYTTRTATPTLTFKHFYDAGTIGTGTIKFRHYSQQEPSTGETWVLNETLNTQNYGITDITFSSNGTTYVKFARYYKTDMLGEVEQDYVAFYSSDTTYDTAYDNGAWSNETYRTITFTTAPTGDLLTWLQANGTKQGGGGGIVELPSYDNWTATKVSGNFVGTLTLYTTNNDGNKIQCGPKGYEWLPKINTFDSNVEFSEVASVFGIAQDSEGNNIIPSEWIITSYFDVRVTNDGLDGGSCIMQIDTNGYFNSIPSAILRVLVYDVNTDTMRVDTCEIDEEIGTLTTKYAYGFNQILCSIQKNTEETTNA